MPLLVEHVSRVGFVLSVRAVSGLRLDIARWRASNSRARGRRGEEDGGEGGDGGGGEGGGFSLREREGEAPGQILRMNLPSLLSSPPSTPYQAPLCKHPEGFRNGPPTAELQQDRQQGPPPSHYP